MAPALPPARELARQARARLAANDAAGACALLDQARHLEDTLDLRLLRVGALNELRRYAEAADSLRHAISQHPDREDLHVLLAAVLSNEGGSDAGIAYLQGLRFPARRGAAAREMLGRLLLERGRVGEALHALVKAAIDEPRRLQVWQLLESGLEKQPYAWSKVLHLALHHLPEVARCIRVGNLLKALCRPDAAEAEYRRALFLAPDNASAWFNLAILLRERGALDQSIAAARRSLELHGDEVAAHLNLASSLLMAGEWREGWHEFEWRLKATQGAYRQMRQLDRPLWQGESLSGRRILLHAEQGDGDSLQFVRFLPQVLARDPAQIVLEVQPGLVELFRDSFPDPRIAVFRRAANWPALTGLPAFDCHCPLHSLAMVLSVELGDLPGPMPYLRASPERRLALAATHAARAADRLNVGLIWRGNPGFEDDRRRSPGLEPLHPLLALDFVHWHALQVGRDATAIDSLVPAERLSNHGPHLNSFAETAAIMSGLDLVISSCTSPLHLAGALNLPVWGLLNHAANWRWLVDRSDSPWYPSLRLFRQARPGDWRHPVREMAAELKRRWASRQAPSGGSAPFLASP